MSLEEKAGQNHNIKTDNQNLWNCGKSKYLGTELNTSKSQCVIAGFRCEVDEIRTLMGNYAACSGNLPTFRANLSVKNPRILPFLTLEDGTDTLSRNVGKELPLHAA